MKYQSTPGLAFALLRSVIGPATSRLSLNQSDPELKTNHGRPLRQFGCFLSFEFSLVPKGSFLSSNRLF